MSHCHREPALVVLTSLREAAAAYFRVCIQHSLLSAFSVAPLTFECKYQLIACGDTLPYYCITGPYYVVSG